MAAVRTQRDSVEAKITRYLAKITRYLPKITRNQIPRRYLPKITRYQIPRYLAKITRYLPKITRYLTLEGASRVTAESAVARAVTALSRPSLHSLTERV